jgi:hypothetical protein
MLSRREARNQFSRSLFIYPCKARGTAALCFRLKGFLGTQVLFKRLTDGLRII